MSSSSSLLSIIQSGQNQTAAAANSPAITPVGASTNQTDSKSVNVNDEFSSDPHMFHARAMQRGVIISFCSETSSGCHQFGKQLQGEYQHLDYISVTMQSDFSDQCDFSGSNIHSIREWDYAFVTGCAHIDDRFFSKLLKMLSSKYTIPKKLEFNILIPPHQSDGVGVNMTSSKDFYRFLRNENYKIKIFTTGIGQHVPVCIGLPTLYKPNQDDKSLGNADCYGLMYHNDPIRIEQVNYFDVFFQKVTQAAKQVGCESPTVIVITKSKELISKFAQRHNIKVIHSERIPRVDFLRCLQNLAVNKGLFSTDGAISHLEALHIGVKCMFQLSDLNPNHVTALIKKLRDNLVPYGRVLLSVDNDYTVLSDSKKIDEVTRELQIAVKHSVDMFASHKSACSTTLRHNNLFHASYRVSIQHHLKQITGLDWLYVTAMDEAIVNVPNSECHRIAKYLGSHNITVEIQESSKPNESILVIDCEKLKIETVRQIPAIQQKLSQETARLK